MTIPFPEPSPNLFFFHSFQAQCKHCEGLINRNDGSTTVMVRHLQNFHSEAYKDYLKSQSEVSKSKAEKIQEEKRLEAEMLKAQDDLDQAQGPSSASQIRKRPVTAPITKYFSKGGPAKYKPDSDLQRRAELDIATYITTSNLSFNHIESPGFRRFITALNPKVNYRSRSGLVKSIIPLLVRNLKEAQDKYLGEHLPKVPGAGFTMDLWSSRGQQSYLSLTIHFLDQKWKLVNLLIACQVVEEPSHTGDLIGEKAEALLEKIPLPDDCHVVFTTDGAKAMIKAMRESPAINEHIVCYCHTLSLCLQDAFAIPMINNAITVLKELAGATHRSIKRITAIRRACNDLDSKCHKYSDFLQS